MWLGLSMRPPRETVEEAGQGGGLSALAQVGIMGCSGTDDHHNAAHDHGDDHDEFSYSCAHQCFSIAFYAFFLNAPSILSRSHHSRLGPGELTRQDSVVKHQSVCIVP